MKVSFVNPMFLGIWLLRATNDQHFNKGTTFVEVKNDYKLKLYTKYTDGIIGKTYKRIGYVVEPTETNIIDLNLYFTKKVLYSYSVLGFKIPEAGKTFFAYEKPLNLAIKREGNTIIVSDKNTTKFYIFDLYVKEYNVPPIETRWNTFLFIQLISFLLNLLLVQAFHLSLYESNEIANWIQEVAN